MRRSLQQGSAWVLAVSVGVLAPFLAVKGTEPTASLVLWGLCCVAGASLVISLLATFAFRGRGSRGPALGVVVGDSWVAAPQNALQAMAVELVITNAGRQRASVEVCFELRLDDGQWSQERPLAPGAVLDSHPHMGVVAVSGSPVAVEARDSYRGWFGVEIGHPRFERAPLDMRVVVRDLLSGATATAIVSGVPETAAAPSADGMPDAVRVALVGELEEGRRLASATAEVPRHLASIGAVLATRLTTSTADVEEWEKRVVHLLHKAERHDLADSFLADVPQPPRRPSRARPELLGIVEVGAAGASMGLRPNPVLDRRLDFRLTQLNTILNREL